MLCLGWPSALSRPVPTVCLNSGARGDGPVPERGGGGGGAPGLTAEPPGGCKRYSAWNAKIITIRFVSESIIVCGNIRD